MGDLMKAVGRCGSGNPRVASAQPLLDWTPAHQSHSPTSKAAAVSIKPRIGPMHRAILRYLRAVPNMGATDEQMQHDLAIDPNTQRPRRRKLQNMDLIVNSGRTRPTQSGRQAVVWILAAEIGK